MCDDEWRLALGKTPHMVTKTSGQRRPGNCGHSHENNPLTRTPTHSFEGCLSTAAHLIDEGSS